MVVDGVGDISGFALSTRVKTADDALQFGEFADHFAGEIAFGEFGGAIGIGDMGFCERPEAGQCSTSQREMSRIRSTLSA